MKILQTISKYVNKAQIEPKTIENRIDKEETNTVTEIFISYPWTNTNRIDEICRVLDRAGIKYKRDTKDCGYRQNIKQFEREIGKGANVLAYINEDYLKSINCMYELALVFQTGDVERRLFPIVTLTGKRDSIFFKDLYDYWNAEYLKKRDLLNNLSSGVSLQVIELESCQR